MAVSTREHLSYIDKQFDSASFGTTDELQAASYIMDIFSAHNIPSVMQEFTVCANKKMYFAGALIAVFLGTVATGIDVLAIKIIGFIFLLLGVLVLVADYTNHPLLEKISLQTQSQNVVAKREGVGELAGKGVRPIVLVAHYDTPKESILVKNNFRRELTVIRRATLYIWVCAVLFSVIKLVLPSPAYEVFWTLSIICGLASLIVGVVTLVDMNAPATVGGNNNKASVAALFKIMDHIVSGKNSVLYQQIEAFHEEDKTTDLSIPEQQPVEIPEVLGVRHGVEVIRQLGILPEECTITQTQFDVSIVQNHNIDITQDKTNVILLDKNQNKDDFSDEDSTKEIPVPNQKASINTGNKPVEQLDQTPFETIDASQAPISIQSRITQFERRSSLLDLPDPSAKEIDPLEDSIVMQRVSQIATDSEQELSANQQSEMLEDQVGVDNIEVLDKTQIVQPLQKIKSAVSTDNIKKITKGFSFFKKNKQQEESITEYLGLDEDFDAKKDGASIQNWENFTKDSDWKGGATTNQFKVIASNTEDFSVTDSVSHDELEASILEMAEDLEQATLVRDEKLLCHDLWFVALGSSEADHAGMSAFVSEYKKELRGAFVINLDAIGAGELSLLSEEGLNNRRKADRRLSRIIKTVAKDLSIPLKEVPYKSADTDATAALRKSMRACTLMGEKSGLPAHWGEVDDYIERVSVDQIDATVELVEEVIRRS